MEKITQSSLYTKLLTAPNDAPVFLSEDLGPEFMLQAYAFGLFPWTSKPVTWWCPNPRCVLFPKEIYKQKSLRRFWQKYRFALDTNTFELIKLCAKRQKTWIDKHFFKAYEKLIEMGFLHSLELYNDEKLVGGIYGLIIGKVFFGESMVSLEKNVSKLALIKLCELLEPYEFLIDCQVHNPHLEFMGAKCIDRAEFLTLLEQKTAQKSGFNFFKNLQKNCL